MRSFRATTNSDIAQISNSYITLVKAKSGDTISSLANKMAKIKDAKSNFLVLNNLYDDDPLIIGQQYKIVKIE